jgi:microsomal dipeptidase-like Zn-dependent dipeptidase
MATNAASSAATTANDASGYQRVLATLEDAGFANHEVDRIAWRNWRRVLAAAWG